VLFHTKRIKFSRRTLRESQRNEDCWFCKSKGDESLIIYEGKSCYVSLEKGPLCRFHLQIVPFNHVETTGRLETSDKEEIEHCAKVISGYFLQNGYEVIEYERYLPLSEAINHTVMHIVPIKEGKLLKKF
jgi:diadenosine tetraphosphate (Ap4A) HIT family hydrolase